MADFGIVELTWQSSLSPQSPAYTQSSYKSLNEYLKVIFDKIVY